MRVVNVKVEQCTVYCGRSCYGRVDVGLGNPFVVGKHGSREECVKLFGELLFADFTNASQIIGEGGDDVYGIRKLADKLQMSVEELESLQHDIHEAISKLRETDVLGCWCKPLSCHADLIHLFWLKQQNT